MAESSKPWKAAALMAGAVAAIGVGAAVVWKADRVAERPVQLRPDDAAVTALGQQVYTARCAACHDARLEGQPHWRERGPDGRLPAPPHDASGHT